MPTRPCTCPTSAPPNGPFTWSRRWPGGPAAVRKGGRVLVQTFNPDHPAIRAAVRHDYRGLRRRRVADARDAPLSAVCGMIRLVVRGPVGGRGRPSLPSTWPSGLRAALDCGHRRTECRRPGVGAGPGPFARLRGKYRFQIQIQGPDGEPLRAAVARLRQCPRTRLMEARTRNRRCSGSWTWTRLEMLLKAEGLVDLTDAPTPLTVSDLVAIGDLDRLVSGPSFLWHRPASLP